MKLALINHGFRYETENILRIFFPFEKIEVTESYPEKDGDYAVAAVSCGENGDDIECEIYINGYYAKNAKTNRSSDPKETERLIALCLFELLTEYASYTPPWGILTGVRPSKLMRSLIADGGEAYADGYFKNKLLVSDGKTKLAYSVAKAEDKIIALSGERSYSLYVSIPFCPTRCSYCSFVSHSIAQAKKLIPKYVELLTVELAEFSRIAADLGLKLETIYFGGGTPTSLDEESLKKVTDAVKANFDVDGVREYTIEAGRPDTLNDEKLRIMKNAGVTRISINPQTFNNDVLNNIGRKHTAEDAVEMYKKARSVGFDCINMDFIAGLPGDSIGSFSESINTAADLAPENITVHTLAFKRASTLVTGKSQDTASKETAEMLAYSNGKLYGNGYFPYYMYRQSKSVGNLENTGWSLDGKECLYNIYMMEEVHTVFAAGGGAVTKLKNQKTGQIDRIFNFKYPYEYTDRFSELSERKNRIYDFYKDL